MLPRKWLIKILWDSEIHLIPVRKPDPMFNNMKKRTCYPVEFLVSSDYWLKLKESEKIDQQLVFSRE